MSINIHALIYSILHIKTCIWKVNISCTSKIVIVVTVHCYA